VFRRVNRLDVFSGGNSNPNKIYLENKIKFRRELCTRSLMEKQEIPNFLDKRSNRFVCANDDTKTDSG
jgi:hypothetical protein